MDHEGSKALEGMPGATERERERERPTAANERATAMASLEAGRQYLTGPAKG